MTSFLRLHVSHSAKKPTATVKCCTLALALSVSNPAGAQSDASVAVTLRIPSTPIRLDRTVPIVVLVTNVEPEQRVVLRGQLGFSEAGGLELVVTDSQGARRTIEPNPGDLTREEARSGNHKVILKAGHGMGIPWKPPTRDLFPAAGHYQVLVNYRSPMPTIGNPSVVEGDIEGSEATSNVVEVEVVQ